MEIEAPVALIGNTLFKFALKQPQFDQACCQITHYTSVDLAKRHPRSHRRYSTLLRRKYHFVKLSLGRAEAPPNGEGTGDIPGIQVKLGTGINQHQLTLA